MAQRKTKCVHRKICKMPISSMNTSGTSHLSLCLFLFLAAKECRVGSRSLMKQTIFHLLLLPFNAVVLADTLICFNRNRDEAQNVIQ